MDVQHYVLYVRNMGQELLIRLWRRRFGVKTDYHLVGWADPHGDFVKKREKLLKQIDHWADKGFTVTIVASSAGASMALHAFAMRTETIHSVVLICPKVKNPGSFIDQVYVLNPAFKVAMQQLPAALEKLTKNDRTNILVVKPQSDRVVELKDMDIKDANILHLPSHGHMWGIVSALTIYSGQLIKFIKRQR
jgi:hypothetical protein